ncbi:MAG TPA: S41 family peptidase, partial [Burkholderiaceae bacterium]|nr:S41 family peptidase [Burkholderiaceae bacterium]
AWSAAIATLLDGAAQDVVVDLRDNSGGLLTVATDVASSLAPGDAVGKLFIRGEYNSGHSDSDADYRFTALPGLGRFERVAWLTSERTCSASEALIMGLRPYRPSPVVGSATCGKPVGFNPEQRDGKVYNIVTFRLVNSDGQSDYFKGLEPTCKVSDDYRKPLGDPGESLFAAAIAALNGQDCPGAAVPKTTTSRIAPLTWDLAAQIGLK